MNIVSLIIELISGAVGVNISGAAMKQSSLGPIGIRSPELWAGGVGGTILQAVTGGRAAAASSGSMDPRTIVSNIAGGGVGGAILMAFIGLIKN